jgi:hypothetical protein
MRELILEHAETNGLIFATPFWEYAGELQGAKLEHKVSETTNGV